MVCGARKEIWHKQRDISQSSFFLSLTLGVLHGQERYVSAACTQLPVRIKIIGKSKKMHKKKNQHKDTNEKEKKKRDDF